MISAKRTAARALSGDILQRCTQLRARRQQYSTAKETTSSSIPWIISAAVITAGGLWFTMGSSKPTDSHASHSVSHGAKEHEELSPEEEKKKKAHKAFMDSMAADNPKPEHRGSSVLNHAIAAEINEHKVRKGKFSGKEFDNHITKHSGDPGKDFEAIEKKDADEAPK